MEVLVKRIYPNNCPFSFTFDTGGCITTDTGICTGVQWTYITPSGEHKIMKYCIYCEIQTNVICEKGACIKCHKENFCHGELKK